MYRPAGLTVAMLWTLAAGCGGGGDAAAPTDVTDPPPLTGEPAPDPPPVSDEPPPPPAPPPEGDTGLSPTRAPARNFDLSHWKLTLPTGLEVKTPQLNADYQLTDVFFTDRETGGMVFRTPNIGGTTANSRFSRTELREVLAPALSGQAPENNWTTDRGGVLLATLRVDHVSTTGLASMTGRLIIGQIHGPTTEVVRLYYEKKPTDAAGRIYAAMEAVTGVTTRATIIANTGGQGIALGEHFTYRIELRGLTLSVGVTDEHGQSGTLVREIDPAYAGLNLYFKAGVYNQNNTGDLTDYAQATFFALKASH